MWTLENLLRLAHCAACAELSDRARSSASTYADGYARGGELAEVADRLVAAAEEVRLLAVAVERERGVSWETIGEVLAGGVSKQAAQKRYGERVDELVLDVLLPLREGPPGGLGWAAGPDGVADPDATLASLDAWARRHHEPADSGTDHLDELVSHGLREQPREATRRIATVTLLADLVMNATGSFATRELPRGVTERYARRRLLEEKVALYDAMRREAKTRQALADALEHGEHAFNELVDCHRADLRERLGHGRADDVVVITLDGRPVQVLAHADDPTDEQVRGWWLWDVSDHGTAPKGYELNLDVWRAARPVLGLGPGEFLADADVDDNAAIAAALDAVCDHIATDAAKGFTPFGPGGIAGPPASE
jgi:hypothetical protein